MHQKFLKYFPGPDTSDFYWTAPVFEFNGVRQNMLLLMAAINGEL